MIQGTPEWLEARRGKVTASRISDVETRTKTGYGAGRKNYAAQLVCEILTGKVEESYTNDAMRWGTENEPNARKLYEFMRDVEVKEIAIVDHPTIAMAAASPDGLVGDDGLIEIKCPNTATHIEYLLGKVPPAKYEPQMMWQMACTGRKWCDFVSYDPRLPEHLQLFVVRLHRDEARIAQLESEVIGFRKEIDQTLEKLSEL